MSKIASGPRKIKPKQIESAHWDDWKNWYGQSRVDHRYQDMSESNVIQAGTATRANLYKT